MWMASQGISAQLLWVRRHRTLARTHNLVLSYTKEDIARETVIFYCWMSSKSQASRTRLSGAVWRCSVFSATVKRRCVRSRHYSSRPSLSDLLAHPRCSHIGPIAHTTNWRFETRVCRRTRSQSTPLDLCLPVHQGRRSHCLLSSSPCSGRVWDHWSRPNLQPSTAMSEFTPNPTRTLSRLCPQRSDLILLRDDVYDGQFDCGNWPCNVARTENSKRYLHSRRQLATCTFSWAEMIVWCWFYGCYMTRH